MEKNENTQVETQQEPEKQPPDGKGLSGAERETALDEVSYHVTRLSLVYRYGFIVILTLIGAGFLYLTIPMYLSTQDYLVLGILVLWGLALLRYWVYLLGMPHRINCRGDGSMELLSVLKRREIPLKEVEALRVSAIHPSYLKIFTSKKKTVSMINHVTGMHDLIERIKKENPELTTKGC